MNVREEIEKHFRIYGEEKIGKTVRFYVVPLSPESEIRKLLHLLSQSYEVGLRYQYGEMVLELKEIERKESYLTNIILFMQPSLPPQPLVRPSTVRR
ncbi:hypothetical protein [Archaeoglobus fulgidus]|uniref:hypothetical protein n=1 Tax=Archaeoglobus fulgidus TaxID=2234 RepID=UPI00214D8845|nr:hypothetical protein [Archaeoglobus fulgidus]